MDKVGETVADVCRTTRTWDLFLVFRSAEESDVYSVFLEEKKTYSSENIYNTLNCVRGASAQSKYEAAT